MGLDFVKIATKTDKKTGEITAYASFRVYPKSKDLLVRGSDFYAVWDESRGLWSTDEDVALRIMDEELCEFLDKHKECTYGLYMWDSGSGQVDAFHKFCQKQARDNHVQLDNKLIFANTETRRDNYASKRLNYSLEAGEMSSYEKLISTLYSPAERHKIEYAIGAIVSGESKKLQKFMVLYGASGTGKSTVLNIIEQLFEGYCSSFDAKALTTVNNQYALEVFKNNPLVAIQHDGDLSRIEDNARLNSLVSHESLVINEKYRGLYESSFNAFLFLGTNRAVKITDAKSGLLRRLIDVTPTGKKVPTREYRDLVKRIKFELGAIAKHCLDVYLEDPQYYDNYVPLAMMGASNDFYNFMLDHILIFKRENHTTLKSCWEMYKVYIDEAKLKYPFSKRDFKEELKNYFWKYEERHTDENGTRVTGYYSDFKISIFEEELPSETLCSTKDEKEYKIELIKFRKQKSIFDEQYADCLAQYSNESGTPKNGWAYVKTKLSDLDTTEEHYLQPPLNLICIDFDKKDSKGNKSLKLNNQEASKWPKTYAELSRSGGGIHLYYIYSGDVSQLSRIYSDDIEIKTFPGNSGLRRKLTKCNDIPIATISSGLPLKGGDKKMVNFDGIKNEKALRTLIKRHMNKDIMSHTSESIQMIHKILNDAYLSGIGYDVSDLRNAIYDFAETSTNQTNKCIKLVNDMPFKSEQPNDTESYDDTLVFYDIETYPNLFMVCWKFMGEDRPIVTMINPKPAEIEELLKFRLVGFNCRKYDNHMLYGALMGYDNDQLYTLSRNIIDGRGGYFGEAYNLSYTDIYDFASAGNKKSLKKLQIEMGIHHQELGIPWDEPVDESLWPTVAEYCGNDVRSTEAAFYYLKGDWVARQILATLSGLTVNDTTNSHSKRIIFGGNRTPQTEFNYRFLADPVHSDRYEEYREKFGPDYIFRVWNDKGLPEYRKYIPGEVLPEGWSILPFFPGYTFDRGKSVYLGQEIGEGGRVYAEEGMYGDVWDADISGQHPATIISEVLFGPKYTKIYADIVAARTKSKHGRLDEIENLFDGVLQPYIQEVRDGTLSSRDVADGIKTVVNSVYGLTKASFNNEFRDHRNIDNIVAKRGALFMTLLTSEVQKRGFTVCHNKTDSIKIPDAIPEIENFVINFGKEYGYIFETEARFEKFCLVNKAVYVAKEAEKGWMAVGDQFKNPYVFKRLFSKEPIEFNDLCVTFAVQKGALYLDVNETLPDVSSYEKEFEKAEDKFKKGKISDTIFESICAELTEKISEGHDYQFVGRTGRFSPVKPNCGGGILVVKRGENKYDAASGSSGYRWMESELLMNVAEDTIDRLYFNKLVDDAVDTISKYGDFEWFVSDAPYISKRMDSFMNIPLDCDEEIPWE